MSKLDDVHIAVTKLADERYLKGHADGLSVARKILVWLERVNPPATPDMIQIAEWSKRAIRSEEDRVERRYGK